MDVDEVVKLIEKEMNREIKWFREHRGYFQTSRCADHTIERLERKRDWMVSQTEIRFAEAGGHK